MSSRTVRRQRFIHEPESHDRWLVSYADLVTLMFAFFVVMYAVSSVNEGKMRVLSDSLVTTFASKRNSTQMVQVEELVESPVVHSGIIPVRAGVGIGRGDREQYENTQADESTSVEDNIEPDGPQETAEESTQYLEQSTADEKLTADAAGGAGMAQVDALADQVESTMSGLINDELVNVRRKDRWLEIELKSSLLFSSGRSALAPAALGVLQALADILKDLPNPIQVEGFTDDIPISTAQFPSNWELSAARAASVVSLFADLGVNPERMAAVGYGEFRPIADNATAEGRSENRRVVLVIPAEKAALRDLELSRASGESSASGINTVQPWAEAPQD